MGVKVPMKPTICCRQWTLVTALMGCHCHMRTLDKSSARVVASAPQLRRQVDDVDPQEHEEPQACDSSDAPEAHGDLWTHVPSEAMQGIPLVVPDVRHPAMDDMGITVTSHGSGIERTVQQEYCSVMSRDESLMPGPRVTCPQVGQPLAKGKE